VAQRAVPGPAAELDLGDEARLGPAGVAPGFRRKLAGEGRIGARDRPEPFPEIARRLDREPRPGPPDMDEPLALVDAEDQRSDGAAAHSRRGREAADHEVLGRGAFQLEPGLAATGPVGRVAALGDHPLEAEPAGVADEHGAIVLQVLAPAHGPAGRSPVESPGEQRLAVEERRAPEVVAIEMEDVEGVEDHAVRPPGLQIRLKGGEVGAPGLVLRHEFAVDERRRQPELLQGPGDRPEIFGSNRGRSGSGAGPRRPRCGPGGGSRRA
jgi:hypothetical protein